jgi:uncharacterized integral membrane protein
MTSRPEPEPSFWKTRRFRLIVFGVIGVLALILVLQNFEDATVRLLFWKAEAPLVWVLLTFMLLGAGVDELVRLLVRRRRTRRADTLPGTAGSEPDR